MKIDEYFKAKVSCTLSYGVINLIKEVLNDSQLGLFRETCFGYFLELPKFEVQCQLIHSLLLRELKQPNLYEFYFDVSGKRLKFGVDEFALVTGLRCVGNSMLSSVLLEENRLITKYFGGLKKINKQSVHECLLSKRWDNDEDCVKIALIYFIEVFLMSSPMEKMVSRRTFDLVESGFYNEYHWGKDVFHLTMEYMKGNLFSSENKKKSDWTFYRLNGFPYAVQIWFYECCPFVIDNICVYNGEKNLLIPRILNWTCKSNLSYKVLQRLIFKEPLNKVKFVWVI